MAYIIACNYNLVVPDYSTRPATYKKKRKTTYFCGARVINGFRFSEHWAAKKEAVRYRTKREAESQARKLGTGPYSDGKVKVMEVQDHDTGLF